MPATPPSNYYEQSVTAGEVRVGLSGLSRTIPVGELRFSLSEGEEVRLVSRAGEEARVLLTADAEASATPTSIEIRPAELSFQSGAFVCVSVVQALKGAASVLGGVVESGGSGVGIGRSIPQDSIGELVEPARGADVSKLVLDEARYPVSEEDELVVTHGDTGEVFYVEAASDTPESKGEQAEISIVPKELDLPVGSPVTASSSFVLKTLRETEEGLEAIVSQRSQSGAIATLRENVSGFTDTLPLTRLDAEVQPDADLKLVDAGSGETFDVTSEERVGESDAPVDLPISGTSIEASEGSALEMNAAYMLARLRIAADEILQRVQRGERGDSLGVLTQDYDGLTESIRLDSLSNGVADNDELVVLDRQTGLSTRVKAEGDTDAAPNSPTSVSIGQTELSAAEGSSVHLSIAYAVGQLKVSFDEVEAAVRRREQARALGVLTSSVSGPNVESLPLSRLRSPVEQGDKFVLVDAATGDSFEVTAAFDAPESSAPVSLGIEPAIVDAANGSTLTVSGSYALAQLRLTRDQILERVASGESGPPVAVLREEVNGSAVTTLPCHSLDIPLEEGDRLLASDPRDGSTVLVVLAADAAASEGDVDLEVEEVDLDLPSGAGLAVPASFALSQVRQRSDEILSRVQEYEKGQAIATLAESVSGEEVSSIPLTRIDATVQEGAELLVVNKDNGEATTVVSTEKQAESLEPVVLQVEPVDISAPVGSTVATSPSHQMSQVTQHSDLLQSTLLRDGEVVTQMTLDYEGMTLDGKVMKSDTWDGTYFTDEDGLTHIDPNDRGTQGWIATDAGDFFASEYLSKAEAADTFLDTTGSIEIFGAAQEVVVVGETLQYLGSNPQFQLRLPQTIAPESTFETRELILGSEASLGEGGRAALRTGFGERGKEVRLRSEGDLGNPEWLTLRLKDLILEGEQQTIQGQTVEIEDNFLELNSNLDPSDHAGYRLRTDHDAGNEAPLELTEEGYNDLPVGSVAGSPDQSDYEAQSRPPTPTLSGIGVFTGEVNSDGDPEKASLVWDNAASRWYAGKYSAAQPTTEVRDGVEEVTGVSEPTGPPIRHQLAVGDYTLQQGLNAELLAGRGTEWYQNASHLDHGTLPEGRIGQPSETGGEEQGYYRGLLGTGTLEEGAITTTFGAIDIGTSTLGAGNTTLQGWIRGDQSGALRIDSGTGFVDIGSKSVSQSVLGFETDQQLYRFDEAIQSRAVGSLPGEDFFIRSGNTNWLHLDQDALSGDALFRVLRPTRFESERTYFGQGGDVRHVFDVEGSRLTTLHGGVYTTFSQGGEGGGFLSVGQSSDSDQRIGQSPQTQVLEASGDVFSSGDVLSKGGLYVGDGMGLLAPSNRPGEGWILADEGLGVGTSSPEAEVHIVGSGGDTGQLLIENAAGGRAELNQFSGGVLNLQSRAESEELGAFEYYGTALYPEANYYTQLGTLQNKWSQAHIGELVVETLTASERRTTMGGRFTVGLGNRLTEPLSSEGEHVTVEHNNFDEGDVLHLEGGGKFEFMRVLSSDPEEITVERPTPENPLTPTDDKVWRYPVERGLDPTPLNEWTEGTGILNTGTPGTGFIDQYALSSLASFDLVDRASLSVSGTEEVANDIGENREYTYSVRFEDSSASELTISAGDFFSESVPAEGRQEVTFEPPVGSGTSTLTVSVSSGTAVIADSRLEYTRDQRVAGPSTQYAIRTGTEYQDIEARAQAGNLRHTYGYGSDAFGFAAGERSGAWISADAEQGFRISRGSTVRGQWDPEGRIWVGPRDEAHLKVTPGSIDDGDDSSRLEGFSGAGVPSSFRIDEDSLRMGRASTAHLYSAVGGDDVELTMRVPQYNSSGDFQGYKRRLQLLSDGSAYFASRDVRIDADGRFIVEDRADIAGFEVRGIEERDDQGNVVIGPDGDPVLRERSLTSGALSLTSYHQDKRWPVISVKDGDSETTLEAALGRVKSFGESDEAHGLRVGTQVSQLLEATQDDEGNVHAQLAGFGFDFRKMWSAGTSGRETMVLAPRDGLYFGTDSKDDRDAEAALYKTGHFDLGRLSEGEYALTWDGSELVVEGHVDMNSGTAGDSVYFGDGMLSGLTESQKAGTIRMGTQNDASPALWVYGPGESSFVRTYYNGPDDWGQQGRASGVDLFQLGSTNQIGKWHFGDGWLADSTDPATANVALMSEAGAESEYSQLKAGGVVLGETAAHEKLGLFIGQGTDNLDDYILDDGALSLAGGDFTFRPGGVANFKGTVRAYRANFEELQLRGPILLGGAEETEGFITTQGTLIDDDQPIKGVEAASFTDFMEEPQGMWLGWHNTAGPEDYRSGAKFALGNMLTFEDTPSGGEALFRGDLTIEGDVGEVLVQSSTPETAPDVEFEASETVSSGLPSEGADGQIDPFVTTVETGLPEGTPVRVEAVVEADSGAPVSGAFWQHRGDETLPHYEADTFPFGIYPGALTTGPDVDPSVKTVSFVDRVGAGGSLRIYARYEDINYERTVASYTGSFSVKSWSVLSAKTRAELTPKGLFVQNAPGSYLRAGGGFLEAGGRFEMRGDMAVEGDLIVQGNRVEEFDQSVPGDLVLNSGQTLRFGDDPVFDDDGIVEKDNLPSDILYVGGDEARPEFLSLTLTSTQPDALTIGDQLTLGQGQIASSQELRLSGGGTQGVTIEGNKIWHAGNDGPHSGLDADLWDGNQFSSFLDQPVRSEDAPKFAGVVFANQEEVNASTHGEDTGLYYDRAYDQQGKSGAPAFFFYADSPGKWGHLWSSLNMGPGSGMDSDSVDGYDGDDLAVRAEDETISGAWTFSADVEAEQDVRVEGKLSHGQPGGPGALQFQSQGGALKGDSRISANFSGTPKIGRGFGEGTENAVAFGNGFEGLTLWANSLIEFTESDSGDVAGQMNLNAALFDWEGRVSARQFAASQADSSSGDRDTVAYRFSEERGWGYNEKDDAVYYNASGSVPFEVAATANGTLRVEPTASDHGRVRSSGEGLFEKNLWAQGAFEADGLAQFGEDVLPKKTNYANLGSADKKWLTVWAQELWVETLVAQHTKATIGGRIVTAHTTSLEEFTPGGQEHLLLKHNNVGPEDILYIDGFEKFEAVRAVGAEVASASSGQLTLPGDWREHLSSGVEFYESGANRTLTADSVSYDGSQTVVFLEEALEDDEPDAAENINYVLDENPDGDEAYRYIGIERGIDRTPESDDFERGQSVLNTQGPGVGFIDQYALSSLSDKIHDEADPQISGPTVEFRERVGTEAHDIETRGATGNLKNKYDYTEDRYGAAFGAYSGSWIGADAKEGVRIMEGRTEMAQLKAGELTVGNAAGSHFYTTGNDLQMRRGDVAWAQLYEDEAGETKLRLGDKAGTRSVVEEDYFRFYAPGSDEARLEITGGANPYTRVGLPSRGHVVAEPGGIDVRHGSEGGSLAYFGSEVRVGQEGSERVSIGSSGLSILSPEGVAVARLQNDLFSVGDTSSNSYLQYTSSGGLEVYGTGTFTGTVNVEGGNAAKTEDVLDKDTYLASGTTQIDGSMVRISYGNDIDGLPELGSLASESEISWDSGNFTGIPERFGEEADGPGLYLTPSYLGHYDGSSFQTYIAANGDFAFKGDSGNYISWNGQKLAIVGDLEVGSEDYWRQSGAFRLGGASGITYSGGSVQIGSDVNVEGDISGASGTFSGRVEAGDALLGGKNGNQGIHLSGGDYIYDSGIFSLAAGELDYGVSRTQALTIGSDAYFEGELQAAGGYLELGQVQIGDTDAGRGIRIDSDDYLVDGGFRLGDGQIEYSSGGDVVFTGRTTYDSEFGRVRVQPQPTGQAVPQTQQIASGSPQAVLTPQDSWTKEISTDYPEGAVLEFEVTVSHRGDVWGVTTSQVQPGQPQPIVVTANSPTKTTSATGQVGAGGTVVLAVEASLGTLQLDSWVLRASESSVEITSQGISVYNSPTHFFEAGGGRLRAGGSFLMDGSMEITGDLRIKGERIEEVNQQVRGDLILDQGQTIVVGGNSLWTSQGGTPVIDSEHLGLPDDLATAEDLSAFVTEEDSPDFQGLSVSGNTVWHQSNDGYSSGLVASDSEKWEGHEFGDYLDQGVRSGDTPMFDGVVFENQEQDSVSRHGRNTGLYYDRAYNQQPAAGKPAFFFYADSTDSWGHLWSSLNMGPGSGMDSDTLDGHEADEFLLLEDYHPNELEDPEITGDVFLLTNSADIEWQADDVMLSASGDVLETRNLADDGYSDFKARNVILAQQASTQLHAVRADRTLNAGNGLSGGGDLRSDVDFSVRYGSSSNTAAEGNTRVNLVAGTGLSGGAGFDVGAGGDFSFTVDYGDRAGTAVEGNTKVSLATSPDAPLEYAISDPELGAGPTINFSAPQDIRPSADPVFRGLMLGQEEGGGYAGSPLQSVDFSARQSGYQITGPSHPEGSGVADFRSIFADEMRVQDFIAEQYSAYAGALIMPRQRAILLERFEVPEKDGQGQLVVEDAEGLPGVDVFEEGSTLRVKVINVGAGEGAQTTNLIPWSDDFSKWDHGLTAEGTTTSPQGRQVTVWSGFEGDRAFLDVAQEDQYDGTGTNSVWIRANKSATVGLRIPDGSNDNADHEVTTDWQRFEVSADGDESTTRRLLIDGRDHSYPDGFEIAFAGAQHEEGARATQTVHTQGSTASRSGGGALFEDIWLSADSVSHGGEGQTWTVTRLDDGLLGLPLVVYAGETILGYGFSGDPVVEMTSIGANAPYLRLSTWEDDSGDGIPDGYNTLGLFGELTSHAPANAPEGSAPGIFTEHLRATGTLLMGDLHKGQTGGSGQYLEYSDGQVTLAGSLVIKDWGSDVSGGDLPDPGATVGGKIGENIFDSDDNNLFEDDLLNTNQLWENVSGDGTPESGATVGADWNDNLNNRPDDDSLLNINQVWDEVTGNNMPQDNATVGADWGNNIGGQPEDDELLNISQIWSQVSGAGRPQDGATAGATVGEDVYQTNGKPVTVAESFDSGSLGAWENPKGKNLLFSDVSVGSGQSLYSGDDSGGPTISLTVDRNPTELEFHYRETSDARGTGMRLVSASGDVAAGFATSNSGREVISDGQNLDVSWPDTGYEVWNRVEVTFDWEALEMHVVWGASEDGSTRSEGTFGLPNMQVAEVQWHNYDDGADWSGDSDCWLDEVTVTTAGGALRENQLITALGKANDVSNLAGTDAFTALGWAGAGKTASDDLDANDHFDRSRGVVLGFQGQKALATRDNVDYNSGDVQNTPNRLEDINSDEGDKLFGIASGATVGADWNDNLNNRPDDNRLLNANQIWGQVSGPGRPQDLATAGATIGSDVYRSSSEPVEIVTSFDSGSLGEWENPNNRELEFRSDVSVNGGQSLFCGADASTPHITLDVDKNPSYFKFHYRETSNAQGSGMRFVDIAGNVIVGFCTSNPSRNVIVGDDNRGFPGETAGYDTWNRVEVTFDWENLQMEVTWQSLDGSSFTQETFDGLPNAQVAQVQWHPFNKNTVWGGDSDTWIDEVVVQTDGGALPENQLITSMGTANDVTNLAGTDAYTALGWAGAGQTASDDLDSNSHFDRDQGVVLGFEGQRALATKDNVDYKSGDVQNTPNRLEDINSDEGDKLFGIAPEATVGATIGTDVIDPDSGNAVGVGTLYNSSQKWSDVNDDGGRPQDGATAGATIGQDLFKGGSEPVAIATSFDGSLGNWENPSGRDFTFDSNVSVSGKSLFCGASASTPHITLDVAKNPSRFEFHYRETSDAEGTGMRFVDAAGNVIVGFCTSNPSRNVIVGDDNRGFPGETAGYDTWNRVEVTFDWEALEMHVVWEALDGSVHAEKTFSGLPNRQVAQVQWHPFNKGTSWSGQSNTWIDEVTVETPGGAEPASNIITSMGTAKDTHSVGGRSASTVKSEARRGRHADQDLDSISQIDRGNGQVTGFQGQGDLATKSNVSYRQDVLGTPSKLEDINSDEGGKLFGIAPGATKGATIGTDLVRSGQKATQITSDFNGSLGDWQNPEGKDLEFSGISSDGSGQSLYFKGGSSSTPHATLALPGNPSSLSFHYRETDYGNGVGLRLVDDSGAVVVGIATSNTSREVVVGDSYKGFPGGNTGTGTWNKVEVSFDWTAYEMEIVWQRSEIDGGGYSRTSSFDLPVSTPTEVQWHPYNNGTDWSGSSEWWFDKFSVTTEAGALPESEIITSMGTASDTQNVGGRTASTVRNEARRGRYADQDLDSISQIDRGNKTLNVDYSQDVNGNKPPENADATSEAAPHVVEGAENRGSGSGLLATPSILGFYDKGNGEILTGFDASGQFFFRSGYIENDVVIRDDVLIGDDVLIQGDVLIGDDVAIQGDVSIGAGVYVEDGVIIGGGSSQGNAFYSFDDQTLQGWTDHTGGNYSFKSGYGGGSALAVDTSAGDNQDLLSVEAEGQPSMISFAYRESSNSNGGGLYLYDNSGNAFLKVGTSNPSWELEAENGESLSGNDGAYDTWMVVEIEFDWSAGQAHVTFTNTSSGNSASGTANFSASGMSKIGFNNGGDIGGSNDTQMRIDNVSIEGVAVEEIGLGVVPEGVTTLDGSMRWGRSASGGYEMKISGNGSANGSENFLKMYYESSGDWGFVGYDSEDKVFELGSDNEIAGWDFTEDRLKSGDVYIRSDRERITFGGNFDYEGAKNSSGVFLGVDGGDAKFALGDKLSFDGESLDIDSSAININSDNIYIDADQVNFDAGNYTITGDHLEIDASTTFGNTTVGAKFNETENDARNQARDSLAYRLGFDNFGHMTSEARARNTIIDGGYISTSVIDADAGYFDDLGAVAASIADFDLEGSVLSAGRDQVENQTGSMIYMASETDHENTGFFRGRELQGFGLSHYAADSGGRWGHLIMGHVADWTGSDIRNQPTGPLGDGDKSVHYGFQAVYRSEEVFTVAFDTETDNYRAYFGPTTEFGGKIVGNDALLEGDLTVSGGGRLTAGSGDIWINDDGLNLEAENAVSAAVTFRNGSDIVGSIKTYNYGIPGAEEAQSMLFDANQFNFSGGAYFNGRLQSTRLSVGQDAFFYDDVHISGTLQPSGGEDSVQISDHISVAKGNYELGARPDVPDQGIKLYVEIESDDDTTLRYIDEFGYIGVLGETGD